MIKSVLFILTVSLLAFLSSCAIYEEPCEGVGQISAIQPNS